MSTESALVVLIPEAESLVGSYRNQFDPSAARGVPAHVTIVYPFIPPSELSPQIIETLGHLFSGIGFFELCFARSKRFPDVLYLVPEPDAELRRLTEMVVAHFPQAPPYQGRFADVVPHLTVAEVSDVEELDSITADFDRQSTGRLPILSLVSEVVLMDNENGRWQVRHRFALAKY